MPKNKDNIKLSILILSIPRDENHFVGQAYAGTGRILHLEDVYFQDYMRESYANLL